MTDGMEKKGWEHFPHEADMGVRGYGKTKEEAFENAAMALTAVITDLDKVEQQEKIEINCEADDDEMLLVDWLSNLVYEMDTRKMLFGRFEVHIKERQLTAEAWGEKVNIEKHQPAVEVKGVSYTALSVKQGEDGTWTAQCVVDV